MARWSIQDRYGRSPRATVPPAAPAAPGQRVAQVPQKIDQQVPGHLQVHLICDNYSTHKTGEINAWLARHPRFHMHFTPTGSSWVNQVERFFGLITEQLIRRGVHTSVPALEADIRSWIRTWNDNPRPFVWTETADEILNSLQNIWRGSPAQDTRSGSRYRVVRVRVGSCCVRSWFALTGRPG
jgi:transposase